MFIFPFGLPQKRSPRVQQAQSFEFRGFRKCHPRKLIGDLQLPAHLFTNLAGHLLYGLSSRHVRSVIVEGRVVWDRSAPCADEAELRAKGREQADRLWRRMEDLG